MTSVLEGGFLPKVFLPCLILAAARRFLCVYQVYRDDPGSPRDEGGAPGKGEGQDGGERDSSLHMYLLHRAGRLYSGRCLRYAASPWGRVSAVRMYEWDDGRSGREAQESTQVNAPCPKDGNRGIWVHPDAWGKTTLPPWPARADRLKMGFFPL